MALTIKWLPCKKYTLPEDQKPIGPRTDSIKFMNVTGTSQLQYVAYLNVTCSVSHLYPADSGTGHCMTLLQAEVVPAVRRECWAGGAG